MSPKAYFAISGTIFLLVALAHLTRLFGGWDIAFAGRVVPHWASLPGLVIPGALSAWGFTLASRVRGAA